MKSRFIIKFNGYHENGKKTKEEYIILNILGEVTIEIIKKELVIAMKLSPYRNNKDIDINYLQAF
jgi:hypothetical protein